MKYRDLDNEAILSSEEKSLLLNSLAELVVYYSKADMKIQWTNEAAAKSLNMKLDDLIGLTCHELWHDSDEPCEGCPVVRSATSGKPEENEIVSPDGRVWWVRGYPIFDEQGKLAGLVEICSEITARKMIESAFKEESERAQLYLDIAGVILVALDVNGRITLLNQKGLQLLGYSNEETIGKNWFDLIIPKNQREEVKDVFHRLMTGEENRPEYYENLIQTKAGELRRIAWQNRILTDKDGIIIGTLSSGEDITEQRKMLEALTIEKEKYQVLFETAPVAIGVSDENGKILEVNWAMQELLGYSERELQEMNAVDTYAHPNERNKLTKALEDQGSVRNLEVLMRRKDGSVIEALHNVDYIHYGEDIVRLTIIRDITELNRTKRQFEDARSRSEFYNDIMAHDLNNVHQGILVGAELVLMKEDLPEEIINHVVAIKEQVTRGIELIENVRKLAAMEQDKTPELLPLDLHNILLNSILIAQHAFPSKKVDITVKFKPGNVTVLGDGFLIDLFYNLIHNAIKYDSHDLVNIEISLEKSEKDGFVRVAVEDNGPGVPISRRKQIFDRMMKGHTLGSGMGLTLVKQISQRYGGSVWVEDRIQGIQSKGSKFIVELPLSKEPSGSLI